jgi:hypothetical protein
MFKAALPFLVRWLRGSFWLGGYEMLDRAPIKSRRSDRLSYHVLSAYVDLGCLYR